MPPLPKGTHIGPYVLLEPLNKGGMAQIYRARQASLSQNVALKVSLAESSRQPQFAGALRQEVDILSRLNHPGVIRILRIPLDGARQQPYMARAHSLPGAPWYYAMEYLRGGTLAAALNGTHQKGTRGLPFSLASAIGYKLVEAVSYIHSREIVHLDIKPENVLLRFPLVKDAFIEPVLIDFGVAAHTRQASAGGGTLITMSPEYLRKVRGDLDPQVPVDLKRVDIYALGVVLYRLWTGQYPFDGVNQGSLTSKILNNTIPAPRSINRELPPQTDELIHAWLSKDPIARPTLSELCLELKYFAAGITRVPEDPAPPKHKGWFGRGG